MSRLRNSTEANDECDCDRQSRRPCCRPSGYPVLLRKSAALSGDLRERDPVAERLKLFHMTAHRRRQTRSDVVRDTLEHYTTTNGSDDGRGRPYDAWTDVIRVISTGAPERGRTTGEQFTAIVRAKARARRAR